jgi:hypothetical protein
MPGKRAIYEFLENLFLWGGFAWLVLGITWTVLGTFDDTMSAWFPTWMPPFAPMLFMTVFGAAVCTVAGSWFGVLNDPWIGHLHSPPRDPGTGPE